MRAKSYARSSPVWQQAARDADCTLWLPGRVPLFFRRIAAGSFRMGARGYWDREEPAHAVTIAQDFYLGTFPVTQEQYRAVSYHSPALRSDPEPSEFKGLRRPVENVSWRDAVAFTAWLTRKRGTSFPEDFARACLPTEAEWEYACRAGTDTEYYTGDGASALAEAGWFGEDWEAGSTHPVGLKKPNAFGLYDLHGNVWEWCHDAFDEAAYRRRVDGESDPGTSRRQREYESGFESMLQSSQPRVLRGGSWGYHPQDCRSSYRLGYGPVGRNRGIGFRVCLVRGAEDSGDRGTSWADLQSTC